VIVPIAKKVGLASSEANVQITMNKNFFVAGEMAYLMANVDNS